MSPDVQSIQRKKNRRDASRPELDPLVRLFEALSDRTRLRILMVLANGERNVGDLVAEFKVLQPTISHHLGLLRMHNLVEDRRNGKKIFYGVASHVSRAGNEYLRIGIDGYSLMIGVPD